MLGLLVWSNLPSRPKARTVAPTIAKSQTEVEPAPAPAKNKTLPVALPRKVSRNGYVSSSACKECHPQQFDSWHDTYHRTMTQVATSESVVAPFDVHLESRGREYSLSKEADNYFVTMADPDWEAGAAANNLDLTRAQPPIVKRQVVMTTGSHHMQGYWVNSRVGNMLRQVPFVYLIEEKRWVPREDIFLSPPDAHRHFAVWNDNCIVCHATKGAPKFDLRNTDVTTEVAELGIACEACHGPGQPHIAFRQQYVDGNIPPEAKDPVINPATCESKVSAQICGQCHSYFAPKDVEAFANVGYTYRAGEELDKSHKMLVYREQDQDTSAFWSDGTCRVSGREFSAMAESKCYLEGSLSCVSCHSMHSSQPNDQLADNMYTNQACAKCHAELVANPQQHTHHLLGSSGSECYNCHMPHTTFGLLKAMRNHRIQSPRAENGDHPNACNLCHLDKTIAWTSEKLNEWYGQTLPEQLPSEPIAASVKWMLQGDSVQRAVLAWHMSWNPATEASGTEWQLPLLAQLLDDKYSVVRYVADKSLRRYAGFEQLHYDYVASPQRLSTAKTEALKLWVPTSLSESTRQSSENLLIDPNTGQLLQEQVSKLLRNQNNRPIFLPE